MKTTDSTTVDVPEASGSAKTKAALVVAPKQGKSKKGLAIFDLILRIGAMVAAIAAAATMATSDETLPFFTQFLQFQAEYEDLPTFQFFIIAIAIVGGYLLLSLPFSIVCIVRPHAFGPRAFLLVMDTVAVILATAAASASAAIVYLAHNGNPNTNWLAICNQFRDFCQATSGAVVAAFAAVALLALLILLSGFSMRRN